MRRTISLLNIHYSLFNIKLAPAISRGAFGGSGWIRTTEANATDLQSAPFGHSGTLPRIKFPLPETILL